MDSLKLSPQELDALTDEERNALFAVMERAREFERVEEEDVHRPIEGQLLKWTNVVKGWQQRWFFLSPDVGLLHYFLSEDKKLMGPRGSLRLIGAVVQPSGEDQLMFSIVPQQGDPYKLKATTAKDRQLWIDRIRRVIEKHTTDVNTLVKAAAASMPQQSTQDSVGGAITRTQNSFRKSKRTKPDSVQETTSAASTSDAPPKQVVDMNKVLHSLSTAHRNRVQINQFIEDSEKFCDPTVLRYKAASQALFKLLDECYTIINYLKVEDSDRGRISSFASLTSGEKSGSDEPIRSNSTGLKGGDSNDEATFSDTYNHLTDSINYGAKHFSHLVSELEADVLIKETTRKMKRSFHRSKSSRGIKSSHSPGSQVVTSNSPVLSSSSMQRGTSCVNCETDSPPDSEIIGEGSSNKTQ